jgi:hypothetical protein
MGWRQGKGIGASKRKIGKSQVRACVCVCVCVHPHLQTQTPLAADFEYAPEDIILQSFEHHTTKHGLGYKPLEHTSVLSETYGKKSEGYKEKGGDKVRTTSDKTRAKGIRGQVGVVYWYIGMYSVKCLHFQIINFFVRHSVLAHSRMKMRMCTRQLI